MDWRDISTVPNTNERVFYGWFGADGPSIGDVIGSQWHEGYYPTATHWAPYERPDMHLMAAERAVLEAALKWKGDYATWFYMKSSIDRYRRERDRVSPH